MPVGAVDLAKGPEEQFFPTKGPHSFYHTSDNINEYL